MKPIAGRPNLGAWSASVLTGPFDFRDPLVIAWAREREESTSTAYGNSRLRRSSENSLDFDRTLRLAVHRADERGPTPGARVR